VSRRRRWGVLLLRTGGRVTASGKGLVLVLVVGLLAGVAGGGFVLGDWPNPFDRHHGRAAPDQRWGTAAHQRHVVGRSGNHTIPKTLRARYPLRHPVPAPVPRRNRAHVAEAPAPKAAKGFDARTSREVPAWRTASERAYVNADGTQTSEFSPTPINYWNGASRSWAPIDSRLVRAGQGWRNAADAVDVRIADRADAPRLATLTYDAAHAVGFSLQGAAGTAGRVEASTATFSGALPDVDVLLQSHSGGVKETLVLSSTDAPRRFVFPLALRGLRAQIVNQQVVFTDEAGRRRAVIPAGFMRDSGQEESTGVAYRLVSVGGRPALEMSLDEAWLNDPHRVFPIQVDPSVESDNADSSLVVHGSSVTSGTQQLLVGRQDGAVATSYLKFSGLVSQLQGHTIYGAQLSAFNFEAPSCKARQVSVHPVTEAWSSSTTSAPSVGTALSSSSFAYGFIASGQTRSACPSKTALFNLGNAGRKLVQGWVDGTQANNGLALKASSTDDLAWKKFSGTGTANPPRLFVTHSPYNAKYAIPDPVPNPPVLQNQPGNVKITVTNLSAETWTPSTYYLAYRAYNADTGAAVTQQRSANLPANVVRGAKVTLTAAIQPLPPGKYFLDFTMVHTGGPVFTDEQVPPARIVLEVVDIPPVLQELYPPNGYEAPTLAPQLWAQAIDIDAPAGSSLQYKFEVCDTDASGKPVNCTASAYQTSPAWVPPAGRLVWSKAYQWRAFVKDATTEVPSPYSTLLTHVPQPAVTSSIAGAPFAAHDREFDPQVGNFSTAAVDASAAAVGTGLKVLRTYNSLDPRYAPVDGVDPQLDAPFGAGWRTQFDMRLTPDNDGSGNVVVSYPDGQEVRFGKNPDGSYAAPAGRVASLTFSSSTLVWTLKDTSGTSYQFDSAGGGHLIKITDVASHSIVLTYNPQDGLLSKAQVSNSVTNTAGRALFFTWSGGHVASVHTDAVNGQALTWTYAYDGDLLKQVCAPGSICTTYEYKQGSHYRSAVLDDRPDSYWRLGESGGAAAGSEVAVNLGKDSGLYHNVTLSPPTPGVIAGSQDTAAPFNGTSSYVELPKGTVKKSRDTAVELWFKATPTSSGGPLLGYQDKAVGTTSTIGVPVLYQGTDGRLHGQFWNGSIAPMASPAVNDGNWHHAVLSSMGGTQTLFLDGNQVATATNPITDTSKLTVNQIGAAYATSPASWPGWGTTSQRFFNGTIDDVAIYNHPLSPPAVKAHYLYGTTAADQLTKVTLPSGRTAAEVDYDNATGRVAEYSDSNGGTWRIGAPTTYGGDADLRRGVEVRDPSNRPYLYEYDALTGQMIRSGSPTGLVIKDEDTADFTPTSTPTPTPTQACTTPDPGDPQFCTTIPPTSDGPVFTGHDADGMAIRSFSYDDNGFMNGITDENGDPITMTNDARGNMLSRTTCRSTSECHTEYFTYPASDPLDPLSYLPTQHRDGRSASATDNQFLTSYTYHFTGQPATITRPNNTTIKYTYSNGSEVAVDGGNLPTGLLLTATDARGAATRYAYFKNGDLAKITTPSGLVTTFTYDALGRMTSKKEVSDTFPAGLTTTYTYDALSRLTSVTEPTTADAVNGTEHERMTTTTYDADGNVTQSKVEDLLGHDPARVTTDDYDDYGLIERVTDPEGNETSYTHDEFGNTTSMVDANGNRYEYGYTARNQLAEVRLRDFDDGGPSTGDYLVLHSYAYDFGGRLARDIDPMGRRTEYTYYKDDLLKTATLKNFHDPDGATRDIALESDTYDGAGNLTHQVNGNGQTVTDQSFNATGTLAAVVQDPTGLARRTAFTYDGNDNITKVSLTGLAANVPWPLPADPQVVNFDYDSANNLTTETQSATGLTSLVTSHTYDQRGLLTSTTDPRGNVTGADKAAFTTTFTNDELGRPTTVTGPAVSAESNGGAAQTVNPVARAGFDTFDDAVAAQDPLGNTTRTAYDRLGRPATVTAPTYTPPGGAPITPVSSTSYDGLGNITETTDPLGNVTRFTYDRLNRVTDRDEPSASNDDRAVWNYTYTRTGQVLSVTDPTGARVESTYDDLDRQATSTQAERHPVAGTFTTGFGYDDAGDLTSQTSPTGALTTNTYNKVGELTQAKDPSGVITTFGYDFAGRQLRVSDGLGRTHRTDYNPFGRLVTEQVLKPDNTVLATQSYTYDPAGNRTAVKDPLNHTTTYDYDAANHLTRQVEPVTDTQSITTTFGYDAAGNRTRYTDGRGNSTIYTVNTLGLPESTIEPSTAAHPNASDRTWTTSYNASGDPVGLTEPGRVTRTRTFDAADRLTAETGTGAPTSQRTLSYDAAGRITNAGTPSGDDTFTYNDRGEVLTADGPSGEGSYGYDADGQLTQRTDASGTSTYTYINARLATMTDGITGTTQTLGYDAAGMPKTIDYGSGRLRSFGYDDFGRLASDQLKNGAGQSVASITYGYDTADRLTSKTTTGTAGAGNDTYTYDFAGRLTSSTLGSTTTSYEWDASGNRTNNGTQTATYDERNRLQSVGGATYTYTPRGTLASKTSGGQTETFSFDAFDRLTAEGGVSYGYNSLDRIATRGGQQFAYAGLETDPVSDGTATYARGPDGEVLAAAEGGNKRITLADQHDDIVGGINPADTTLAGLTESAAYDPFGQPTAQSTGGITGNVGFQDDWTDPATGQVDMGARWYDPGAGVFDSRDDQSLDPQPSVQANRYAYAGADPLDLTDPTGHAPCNPSLIQQTSYTTTSHCHTTAHGSITINKPGHFSGGGGGGAGRTPPPRPVDPAPPARRRNKHDAQHNHRPPPNAALKPIYPGGMVSPNPHLPAKRVAPFRDVVRDHNKEVGDLYDGIVGAAGPIVHETPISDVGIPETSPPPILGPLPAPPEQQPTPGHDSPRLPQPNRGSPTSPGTPGHSQPGGQPPTAPDIPGKEPCSTECATTPVNSGPGDSGSDDGGSGGGLHLGLPRFGSSLPNPWDDPRNPINQIGQIIHDIGQGLQDTGSYLWEHVGISVGGCFYICLSLTVQDGEVWGAWGGIGRNFDMNEFQHRGKAYFGWGATVQWTSAKPDDQQSMYGQVCAFYRLGGCGMVGGYSGEHRGKWYGASAGAGFGLMGGFMQSKKLSWW
jgi:RHS repeat-associated protein